RNEYGSRVSIEGVVSRTVRDTAAVWEYLTRVPNGGFFFPMGPPRGSYLDVIRREPGQRRGGLSPCPCGLAPAPGPVSGVSLRGWWGGSGRWRECWRALAIWSTRSRIARYATGPRSGLRLWPSGSAPRYGSGRWARKRASASMISSGY